MGGYWWQRENREQRAYRLMLELAVDLGRLPTIDEAKAFDDNLPSDAAFYYSSYTNLCQKVAVSLYGSIKRTCPTEPVSGFGRRCSKQDTAEELQARYEMRLKELNLAPKDPERLTKPAPMPEGVTVPKTPTMAKSRQDDVLITMTGKAVNRWTGRAIKRPVPELLRKRQDHKAEAENDQRSESTSQSELAGNNINIDQRSVEVAEMNVNIAKCDTLTASEQDEMLELAAQVLEQVLTEVSEGVEQLDSSEILSKEVAAVAGKQTSAETCLKAVWQAYAAMGEDAFRYKTYNAYAKKHGLPAILTIERKLGKKPKEWRELLEEQENDQRSATDMEVSEAEEASIPSIEPEVSEATDESEISGIKEGTSTTSDVLKAHPKSGAWGDMPENVEEWSKAARTPEHAETKETAKCVTDANLGDEVTEIVLTGVVKLKKTTRSGNSRTVTVRFDND